MDVVFSVCIVRHGAVINNNNICLKSNIQTSSVYYEQVIMSKSVGARVWEV